MKSGAEWTTWRRPDLRGELAQTQVVVLYGGTSSERDVSLVSGGAILQALREAPPEAPDVPRGVIGVEIDASGGWILDGAAMSALHALQALPSDAVFLIGLHGGRGEDGTIAAFLETSGRRYTGSGVAAASLCMNKHRTRLVLEAAGLVTAPGRLIVRGDRRAAHLRELAELGGPPWFVKANCGGSSVDLFRALDAAQLEEAVTRVLALGSDALVEVGITGIELTCGVIGNPPQKTVALPPVEIRPKPGRFFDYEEKYSEGGATEICPPESVDARTCEQVQSLAQRAYAAAGCTGYARVDFMLRMDAAAGATSAAGAGERAEPVVLEINTLPGFTPASLLPQEAAATGVTFRELCLELVALAIDRFRQNG